MPDHLVSEIATRVGKGVHAWKAYAAWLAACGINLRPHHIEYHFSAVKADPNHGQEA